MAIPTWISLPLCLVLPWLSAAMWYAAGKIRERRRSAQPTPQRTSYVITVNFEGKPANHPDFEAEIRKVLEDAHKAGAS